ncbi:MAG: Na+/H+ antiporter subunit B [Trueperaceae bacterium]|nr:Na+/H+ antiporter subunit B [Trueperaceae bacterium]
MNSLILRTTTRLLIGVLLLFSVFLLLRGHDLPGGGFIGGLVGAAAIALYAIAYGYEHAFALLRIRPRTLIGVGLSLAVLAGILAAFAGEPMLTGLWWIRDVGPWTVKLSTPLLFDVGVYLVVIGVVLRMLFSLEEH